MHRHLIRSLVITAACTWVGAQAQTAAPMPHPELSGGPSREVAVSGAVGKPLRLDVAALTAQPAVEVSAGGHRYTGAALWPLLQGMAGIRGTSAKNPTVSMYLLAGGTDGYRVVLSLAEIDPDFGHQPAIVAYEMDGQPLGRSGALRLVVPGDVKMARSVSNLDTIELFTTGAKP